MIVDVVIAGCGIVGLATAIKIKDLLPNLKVVVVEKEERPAMHQTGNNSGVIHSGIYYKPGSLKAKNCINGYKLLIDYCNSKEVKYDLCGKIILATNNVEKQRLNDIYNRGIANGLNRIKLLNQSEISDYEPYAKGIAAIHVPYTGIINYTDVCNAMENDFVNNYNGKIVYNNKVLGFKTGKCFNEVKTDKQIIQTVLFINCCGLHSDRVSKYSVNNTGMRIIPFRGEYYSIKEEKQYLVKNLIYPVPNPSFPFLGVHFTRTIKGYTEAGPNAVLAFKREGYNKLSFSFKDSFDTLLWPGFIKVMLKYGKIGLGEFYRSYNKNAFVKELQKLIPEISKDDLIKGGAGVRAQACLKNGLLADDFIIIENKHVINVCNAPSPAATSCFSIGKHIADIVYNRYN